MFPQQQQLVRNQSSPKHLNPQFVNGQQQSQFFQPMRKGSQQPMVQGRDQQCRQQAAPKTNPPNQNRSTLSEPEQMTSMCRAFGPSTPQKMNVFSSHNSLRVFGSSVHQESFRNSSQKKQVPNYLGQHLQNESPQPQLKQINGSFQMASPTNNTSVLHNHNPKVKDTNQQLLEVLKRQNTHESQDVSYSSLPAHHSLVAQDIKNQHLIQENKKLNEFIQRQFKEKQDMKNHIESLQAELKKSGELKELQLRVERLAQVVEDQAAEIDQWKLKYQQASESDDQRELVEQMEKQILVVVEENERLNNLKEEMEITIKNLTAQLDNQQSNKRLTEMQRQIEDLENQITTQRENELLYQDEIVVQRNEKLKLQSELDDLKDQLVSCSSFQPTPSIGSSSFITTIRMIEQQVEAIVVGYEQSLLQQKENYESKIKELQIENDYLNERRGSQPRIGDVQENVRFIREALRQFYCL